MSTYTIKILGTNDILARASADVREVEGAWYFAADQVDMTHLHITQRTYTCPYKGVCYWIDLDAAHTRAQNVGWVYFDPKPGYEYIKGKIAFYARSTAGTEAQLTE
jgi:uncharacterized protein (DUF427 family)